MKSLNTANLIKYLIIVPAIFVGFMVGNILNANAATKTASVSGNWNSTATWSGAAIPVNFDDVVVNTGITVTAGTLNFSRGSAIGTLNAKGDFTHSGGTLTESGTGNLTLSGAYTYTGATTLNGGTITMEQEIIAKACEKLI